MSSNNSRDYSKPTKRELALNWLLNGIDKKFKDDEVIRINGKPHTKAEFRTKVAAALAPEVECRFAHVALARACAARKTNAKPTDTLITLSKKALVMHYGDDAGVTLNAYGVKPPKKRRKATAQEKVDAMLRGRETRQLRGTKGPKQKKAIKGSRG